MYGNLKSFVDFRKIHRAFKAVAKQDGIEGVRLHELRRSFASWVISNGVDRYTVSRLLGHWKTAITQKVYARLDIEALRKGVEVVGRVLGRE